MPKFKTDNELIAHVLWQVEKLAEECLLPYCPSVELDFKCSHNINYTDKKHKKDGKNKKFIVYICTSNDRVAPALGEQYYVVRFPSIYLNNDFKDRVLKFRFHISDDEIESVAQEAVRKMAVFFNMTEIDKALKGKL